MRLVGAATRRAGWAGLGLGVTGGDGALGALGGLLVRDWIFMVLHTLAPYRFGDIIYPTLAYVKRL
jgi:hypothetical protein